MSEYIYDPKENITLEELTAIVGWMTENSTFYGIPPKIAERHFSEYPGRYYRMCVNCGSTNEYNGEKCCKECGFPFDKNGLNIIKKIKKLLGIEK